MSLCRNHTRIRSDEIGIQTNLMIRDDYEASYLKILHNTFCWYPLHQGRPRWLFHTRPPIKNCHSSVVHQDSSNFGENLREIVQFVPQICHQYQMAAAAFQSRKCGLPDATVDICNVGVGELRFQQDQHFWLEIDGEYPTLSLIHISE